MTQVSRYGHMLKVTVSGMRMRVTARYRVDGSVLNDTIQGQMLGAETTLEIDSPDSPERVARVVRNAERGCFVMQALLNPVPVTGRTLLNGASLEAARSPLRDRPCSANLYGGHLKERGERRWRVWGFRRHASARRQTAGRLVAFIRRPLGASRWHPGWRCVLDAAGR